jgi:hypothetical protein
MSVNLGCSVNLPAVGAAIVLEGTTPAEAAALNPAAQSRLVRGPLPGAWRSPVPAPAAEGDGGGMPVGNTLRHRRGGIGRWPRRRQHRLAARRGGARDEPQEISRATAVKKIEAARDRVAVYARPTRPALRGLRKGVGHGHAEARQANGLAPLKGSR